MRRSEIIKTICTHINDNVSYFYKNGVTFQEYEADFLLSALEKQGMLPPSYDSLNPSYSQRTFSSDSDWNYLGEVEKGARKYSLTIHGEWEPENDT